MVVVAVVVSDWMSWKWRTEMETERQEAEFAGLVAAVVAVVADVVAVAVVDDVEAGSGVVVDQTMFLLDLALQRLELLLLLWLERPMTHSFSDSVDAAFPHRLLVSALPFVFPLQLYVVWLFQ